MSSGLTSSDVKITDDDRTLLLLKDAQSVNKPSLFHPLSRRFHFLLLIMMCFFCMINMQTNLGMAITCMVNSTAIYGAMDSNDSDFVLSVQGIDSECSGSRSRSATDNDYGGALLWSTEVQARILSAPFYGSLIMCFPAGFVADHVSSWKILLATCFVSTLCTIFISFSALYVSYWAVFALRFIIGLSEAFLMPAMNKMIIRWIPPEELSTIQCIFYTMPVFTNEISEIRVRIS